MAEARTDKPLIEKIRDRISDVVDGLVDALDGLMQPEPHPARIPIRPARLGPRGGSRRY